jgi:hypothetical protein
MVMCFLAKVKYLLTETKSRCVDIRYIDDKWLVLVSSGNQMVPVAGSTSDSDTPEEAIDCAIDAWRFEHN